MWKCKPQNRAKVKQKACVEISTATRITNLNMAGLTEIKTLETKIALGKAGGDTLVI